MYCVVRMGFLLRITVRAFFGLLDAHTSHMVLFLNTVAIFLSAAKTNLPCEGEEIFPFSRFGDVCILVTSNIHTGNPV